MLSALPRLGRHQSVFSCCVAMCGSVPNKSFRRRFQLDHSDFYDEKKLEQEMRRVFDVCHGCRACFNLCDAFPTLFELVDKSPTEEIDSVPGSEFKKVVDDCTLCDMCFMVSCPYVPPHSLDIDFPHLIARYKAVELQKTKGKSLPVTKTYSKEFLWPNENEEVPVKEGVSRSLSFQKDSFLQAMVARVDVLGNLAAPWSGLVNKLLKPRSSFRGILQSIVGIDKRARLPSYVSKRNQLVAAVKRLPAVEAKKTSNRKVVLYGTCISQYNRPEIGISAKNVLERNGVKVEVIYEGCCGMPQFERGDFLQVKNQSKKIIDKLLPYIQQGYDVVSVVASCSLMIKKEWPLLFPEDNDIATVASKTSDISEYFMKIANSAEGVDKTLDENFSASISLHNACHSRAQNIGFKSRDMLNLFRGKKLDIKFVARCSGHGGIWGTRKENFDKAMKVGKTAINQVIKQSNRPPHQHFIVSDCPLASDHLAQGMEIKFKKKKLKVSPNVHPIEIVAMGYGLHPTRSP